MTAVEEDLKAPPGPIGFLQEAVFVKALTHRRTHDWENAVSSKRLFGVQLAHLSALCLLLVAMGVLASHTQSKAARLALANKRGGAFDVQVVPGDAEIERGSPLLVVARFGGAVPPRAKLVLSDSTGASVDHAMTRSLEDPTFACRIESVESNISYRIEFADSRTQTYRIRVFENPIVQRIDAKLVYPGYTASRTTDG